MTPRENQEIFPDATPQEESKQNLISRNIPERSFLPFSFYRLLIGESNTFLKKRNDLYLMIFQAFLFTFRELPTSYEIEYKPNYALIILATIKQRTYIY